MGKQRATMTPDPTTIADRASQPVVFKWPTLGDKLKSWEGTCDYCGEAYPPDTRIAAVWSPTRFFISCRCSPQKLIAMEIQHAPI